MRTILFRAKRTDNGEWVRGAAARTALGDGYYILARGTKCKSCSVQQDTIGQYIGLDDRNGEPIYEGDIVRHDYTSYTVKWDNDIAMFILDAGKWACNFLMNKNSDVEIIGNIHNNPELLEVTE